MSWSLIEMLNIDTLFCPVGPKGEIGEMIKTNLEVFFSPSEMIIPAVSVFLFLQLSHECIHG